MASTTVLRGGWLLDTERRCLRRNDLLISGETIAEWLEPGQQCVADQLLDVSGRVVIPAFSDAHLHIESSMLTPGECCRAVLCRGTGALFVDPHEIANVGGVAGVEFFLDQAAHVPVDLFVAVPSCVPATPLEHAGGHLGVSEIDALLERAAVYGLGEMMNFPAIVHGLGEARAKVTMAVAAGKIVDGHAPGLTGEPLKTYISNGENDGIVRIMSDHECTTRSEAIEKRAAGMTIALRYGTASKDLDNILPGLWQETSGNLQGFMLCCDDLSAADLLNHGHMDRIVRRARDILCEDAALPPEQAAIESILMATANTAEYFSALVSNGQTSPFGRLTPGGRANVAVLDSLETMKVTSLLHRGTVVFPSDAPRPPWTVPDRLRSSVQLSAGLSSDMLEIHAASTDPVRLRIMGCTGDSLLTEERVLEFVPASNQSISADASRDCAKIAVFERHGVAGTHSVGLVQGMGMQRGAIASTVAHDSHNLVVVGMNDDDMIRAAAALRDCGGGLAVAVAGAVELLSLDVGGLMSCKPINDVVREFEAVVNSAQRTGTVLHNPFMTLSFLSLPVIPQLKITDCGLVDVNKFAIVPLTAEQNP